MRTRKIVLAAFGSIAFSCTAMQAAVIIQTESTENLDALLTFNQFDTALGQLTSIIVKTSSTLTSGGSFSNTGRSAATARTELDATYTLDLPNTTITSPDEHIDTGVLHVPSNQTIYWGPLSASTSTHDTFTLLSDLISYEGSGTFGVSADETIINSGFRTGTGSTKICEMAALDVTICYNYTPSVAVPEASTVWGGALALGIACFAMVSRKPYFA